MVTRLTEKRLERRDKANMGFTLVELAVAVALVGLLVGGGMLLMKSRIERKLRQTTLEQMEEAKKAILAYARVNKRPPSPDTDGNGTADGGKFGYLPYKALGLAPKDAWGRRVKYAVVGENVDLCACLKSRPLPSGCNGLDFVQVRDGSWVPMPFALISGGTRDMDLRDSVGNKTIAGEERVFDAINDTVHNYYPLTGSMDFVKWTPISTFDDLLVYGEPLILYQIIGCGAPLTPQ